jgi:hypothetical protein
MNGGGGDSPENSVEALINASGFCPECEDIIMIADNYATPRDLKLIKQVNKPVKLILCGTQNGINTLYLDFLRANKGSLHTMEKDILDLAILKEGETIEINGKTYQIKHGSFVKMMKM